VIEEISFTAVLPQPQLGGADMAITKVRIQVEIDGVVYYKVFDDADLVNLILEHSDGFDFIAIGREPKFLLVFDGETDVWYDTAEKYLVVDACLGEHEDVEAFKRSVLESFGANWKKADPKEGLAYGGSAKKR
jgi:hypothetical protein